MRSLAPSPLSKPRLLVVGAGLAGCEAAWQAAERGIAVTLVEMKPERLSPAHVSADFAELVCSNSLRASGLGNAVGLLLEYTALRRGKVGIVTPVTSTEGAIAAVLAVATGEALGLPSAVILAIVALGIVLLLVVGMINGVIGLVQRGQGSALAGVR